MSSSSSGRIASSAAWESEKRALLSQLEDFKAQVAESFDLKCEIQKLNSTMAEKDKVIKNTQNQLNEAKNAINKIQQENAKLKIKILTREKNTINIKTKNEKDNNIEKKNNPVSPSHHHQPPSSSNSQQGSAEPPPTPTVPCKQQPDEDENLSRALVTARVQYRELQAMVSSEQQKRLDAEAAALKAQQELENLTKAVTEARHAQMALHDELTNLNEQCQRLSIENKHLKHHHHHPSPTQSEQQRARKSSSSSSSSWQELIEDDDELLLSQFRRMERERRDLLAEVSMLRDTEELLRTDLQSKSEIIAELLLIKK